MTVKVIFDEEKQKVLFCIVQGHLKSRADEYKGVYETETNRVLAGLSKRGYAAKTEGCHIWAPLSVFRDGKDIRSMLSNCGLSQDKPRYMNHAEPMSFKFEKQVPNTKQEPVYGPMDYYQGTIQERLVSSEILIREAIAERDRNSRVTKSAAYPARLKLLGVRSNKATGPRVAEALEAMKRGSTSQNDVETVAQQFLNWAKQHNRKFNSKAILDSLAEHGGNSIVTKSAAYPARLKLFGVRPNKATGPRVAEALEAMKRGSTSQNAVETVAHQFLNWAKQHNRKFKRKAILDSLSNKECLDSQKGIRPRR